jgi:hypothetical protein
MQSDKVAEASVSKATFLFVQMRPSHCAALDGSPESYACELILNGMRTENVVPDPVEVSTCNP